MKHLRKENSSNTAIINILSVNINHNITHSSDTSYSSIQQNDFTQTPKYANNTPFKTTKETGKTE